MIWLPGLHSRSCPCVIQTCQAVESCIQNNVRVVVERLEKIWVRSLFPSNSEQDEPPRLTLVFLVSLSMSFHWQLCGSELWEDT